MTTISRSATRKIAAIKDKNPTCKVFSLRNDFAATECDPEYAWKELGTYQFARLTVDDSGLKYTIRVHSNLWYELTVSE